MQSVAVFSSDVVSPRALGLGDPLYPSGIAWGSSSLVLGVYLSLLTSIDDLLGVHRGITVPNIQRGLHKRLRRVP